MRLSGGQLHGELMNPSKHFPLIITDKFAETKAFYTEALGCALTHDLDGYIQVRFGDAPEAPELAFAPPDSMPVDHGVFGGDGFVLSVPTQNADAHFERLRDKGVKIASEPSDKPWGWRSYALRDPNGLWLDFFHVAQETAAADAAS